MCRERVIGQHISQVMHSFLTANCLMSHPSYLSETGYNCIMSGLSMTLRRRGEVPG